MSEMIKLPGTAAARARTCLLITSLTFPLWAAATVTTPTPALSANVSVPMGERAGHGVAQAQAQAHIVGAPAAAAGARQAAQHADQRATAPAPLFAATAGRFGTAAAPDQLERTRGGADAIATDAGLNGSVTNNSASHMATGTNRIETGSFAGAVGLPVVIQNSGANVLIQNATVINLQLK